MSFDDATALRHAGDDAFAWDVPDGWQQGRGAWGGLVIGVIVRAVSTIDAWPVRTVSAQIMSPAVVGEHRVAVVPLRRGRAMSTWRVEVSSAAGDAVATAAVVTGTARSTADESATWGTASPPVSPPAAALPVAPIGPPLGPVFAQHLEMRYAAGLPLSGGPARVGGWVRLREVPAPSAAWLSALVDAFPPAAMACFTEIRRIATVDFTANLLVDPATLDPAEPLLYEGDVVAAADGYTSEHRQLWSADGRLVVDNVQSIVVG